MINSADEVPDLSALSHRSAPGLSAACRGPDLMHVPSIIHYISHPGSHGSSTRPFVPTGHLLGVYLVFLVLL